jgi:hypothetical protein
VRLFKTAERCCSLAQGITLAWMLAECGVSLYAAATARSPAILAFGSEVVLQILKIRKKKAISARGIWIC